MPFSNISFLANDEDNSYNFFLRNATSASNISPIFYNLFCCGLAISQSAIFLPIASVSYGFDQASNQRIGFLHSFTDYSLRMATQGMYGITNNNSSRANTQQNNPIPDMEPNNLTQQIQATIGFSNQVDNSDADELKKFFSNPSIYIDDVVDGSFLYSENDIYITSSSSLGATNRINKDLIQFVKLCFHKNQMNQNVLNDQDIQENKEQIKKNVDEILMSSHIITENEIQNKINQNKEILEKLELFFLASEKYGKKVTESNNYKTFRELFEEEVVKKNESQNIQRSTRLPLQLIMLSSENQLNEYSGRS